MGKFVEPKVYWVGYQEMNDAEVLRYLNDSGNNEFLQSILEARKAGLKNAEILCSMFAKLCYKSLTLGKNANISRVRDIMDNIRGCFDVGHGSVFEHVGFNFIAADCSRVFTHELVRHRVGTAFSQNSGRYILLEDINIVFDPILDPIRQLCTEKQRADELWYAKAVEEIGLKNMTNFDRKKKITSALRRFAPNGQSNEIAFTLNLRTLRHTVMVRTARHAEWEIRQVFGQVYFLLKDEYPMIFHGAKEQLIDGLIEVSGMKLQPYEKTAEDLLKELTDDQLEQELVRRKKIE
ncbi:MAG: thymidylate synthase, flavin-dependent [Candidatus Yanofskybacteria bacterium RIFCSPHIGHO2_01_FULL_44_17]|uniref:FAD-dependent thymidylate synthase n=1 Tax=Candidatus Yanofskybacteria bacterium RIFCSPHIGHO2_01_FULL_44_17 TaxID=1802668 RepID=A0A1F8EWR3_9BACT|nr:MAG: thymidylate synthase, flavin-dependent [Candidatus Yanofskybacteria bacterium RIFCSPHIGHO2_01_FULL_44_17]